MNKFQQIFSRMVSLLLTARFLAFPLVMGLLLVVWLVPMDGVTRPGLLLFLGRFHPLVVHLPIAFVLLLPLFEIPLPFISREGRQRAGAFLLFVAMLTLTGAILFGWGLGYAGGYQGSLVMQHAWGALITAGFLAGAVTFWPSDRIRVITLLGAVVAVSVTGHFGGELTHGTDYLTEYAPDYLKPLLTGKWEKRGDLSGGDELDQTVYTNVLAPAFKRSCLQCHNQENSKGGLALDSYDNLMKGGQDEPAVTPKKDGESGVVQRQCLAPDDEDVMPPQARPGFTPAELSILRGWILAGAQKEMVLGDLQGILPEGKSLVASLMRKLRPKPVQVPDSTPVLAGLRTKAQSMGVQVLTVTPNPRDGLVLSALSKPEPFTDEKFKSLAPDLAPYVIEMKLGRTALTDAAFASIESFKHLQRIDLTDTKISAATASRLVGMPTLKVAILTGTNLDPEWLAGVKLGRKMETLGLFLTPIKPEALKEFAQAHPKVEVLGNPDLVPPPIPAPTTLGAAPSTNSIAVSSGVGTVSPSAPALKTFGSIPSTTTATPAPTANTAATIPNSGSLISHTTLPTPK